MIPWDRKFDVYKECGWSEEEIHVAFKNYPLVMEISEGKIKSVMDFIVNAIGLQSSLVAAKCPNLIGLNMEKRIVPRGLFVKDLVSKGLVKEDLGLCYFFSLEKSFLKRFVCVSDELLKRKKLNLAAGGKLLKSIPKLGA